MPLGLADLIVVGPGPNRTGSDIGVSVRRPVDDILDTGTARALSISELASLIAPTINTRTGRQLWVPASTGVIGGTAGFANGGDGNLVTVPAAQTGATFTIPIEGLHLGDTLQGVDVVAQVESAGNAVTVALDVRKQTLAAADFADLSLDTAASGSLTADTAISPTDTAVGVSALAEVLAAGEHLYALLTVTTAATTDVAVAGLIVTYDQV